MKKKCKGWGWMEENVLDKEDFEESLIIPQPQPPRKDFEEIEESLIIWQPPRKNIRHWPRRKPLKTK
jgi:hypothetical protein